MNHEMKATSGMMPVSISFLYLRDTHARVNTGVVRGHGSPGVPGRQRPRQSAHMLCVGTRLRVGRGREAGEQRAEREGRTLWG